MYMIEKDWITKAGYRAIVIVRFWDSLRYKPYEYKKYRCGYVGVPQLHPLYGVDYMAEVILPLQKDDLRVFERKYKEFAITKHGILSPLSIFDVHGGLTYSGSGHYPVLSKEWWFGFDCTHLGDGYIDVPSWEDGRNGHVWSLEEVVQECEKLAQQLKEISEGRLPRHGEEAKA